MRRNPLLKALVVAALACFIATTSAFGQTARPAEPPRDDERQVLRALLDEVRQLRLALQRANVVSHRLQVMLERIRLQQARVDSISRALEGVRSRLADLRAARPQMEEQVKFAEELADRTAEPNRRSEVEREVKDWTGWCVVTRTWSRSSRPPRRRPAGGTR
jgi:hypothetical protein